MESNKRSASHTLKIKIFVFEFVTYEGRTESREQPFFACNLGTADEGEYDGSWNQLLCYP